MSNNFTTIMVKITFEIVKQLKQNVKFGFIKCDTQTLYPKVSV